MQVHGINFALGANSRIVSFLMSSGPAKQAFGAAARNVSRSAVVGRLQADPFALDRNRLIKDIKTEAPIPPGSSARAVAPKKHDGAQG